LNANVYEGMFLLDPNRASTAWESCKKDLEDMLTARQAEILYSGKWDERRLAYDIKGHRKGVYALAYFRAPGDSIPEIERECQLSQVVLRSMILKVEPKFVDAMLAKVQPPEEVEAPVVETPAEAPVETPAEAPAETLTEVPAETPAEAPATEPVAEAEAPAEPETTEATEPVKPAEE